MSRKGSALGILLAGLLITGSARAADEPAEKPGNSVGEGLGEAISGFGHLVNKLADAAAGSAETAGAWVSSHLDRAQTSVVSAGDKADKKADDAATATRHGVAKTLKGVGGFFDRVAGKVQATARKVDDKP